MTCPCCDSNRITSSPARLAPFVSQRVNGRDYTGCWSLQCQDCGVLFSSVRFTDEQARRLYAGYRDAKYTAEREKYEPGYTNPPAHDYISEVELFLDPHLGTPVDILDWGGGDGNNTPFRRLNTWALIDIYDISAHPVKPYGKYNLVVCSNLLEHVPWPLATLEEIEPHMGDILYLEIPMGAVDDNSYKTKTEWHEHINFFTLKSLEMLLRRAGLNVVDFRRHDLTGTKYYDHLLMIACKKG